MHDYEDTHESLPPRTDAIPCYTLTFSLISFRLYKEDNDEQRVRTFECLYACEPPPPDE